MCDCLLRIQGYVSWFPQKKTERQVASKKTHNQPRQNKDFCYLQLITPDAIRLYSHIMKGFYDIRSCNRRYIDSEE